MAVPTCVTTLIARAPAEFHEIDLSLGSSLWGISLSISDLTQLHRPQCSAQWWRWFQSWYSYSSVSTHMKLARRSDTVSSLTRHGSLKQISEALTTHIHTHPRPGAPPGDAASASRGAEGSTPGPERRLRPHSHAR